MEITTIKKSTAARKSPAVKKLHNNNKNNDKTIIVINEHFTGSKSLKEKMLYIMLRRLKDDN